MGVFCYSSSFSHWFGMLTYNYPELCWLCNIVTLELSCFCMNQDKKNSSVADKYLPACVKYTETKCICLVIDQKKSLVELHTRYLCAPSCISLFFETLQHQANLWLTRYDHPVIVLRWHWPTLPLCAPTWLRAFGGRWWYNLLHDAASMSACTIICGAHKSWGDETGSLI